MPNVPDNISWFDKKFAAPILRVPLDDDQCHVCGGRLGEDFRCEACELEFAYDTCVVCELEQPGRTYGMWTADEIGRHDATTVGDLQQNQTRTQVSYGSPYHRRRHICNRCYLDVIRSGVGCTVLAVYSVAAGIGLVALFAAVHELCREPPRYGDAIVVFLIFGAMAAGLYALARHLNRNTKHKRHSVDVWGETILEGILRGEDVKAGKSGGLYRKESTYEENGGFTWPKSQ